MSVLNKSGEKIGVLTSGTFSPTLKVGIGLALLSPQINIGDIVQVDIRGRFCEATVVKAPFVDSKVR